MKYKAVLDTDEFKDFEFFEDGNGKYIHGIDAGAVNNEWIALYFTECEKESVLDKIRAEIEELDYITFDGITKRRCLKIIDKYKAENEDKK